MTDAQYPDFGLQLFSTVTNDGVLELSLRRVPLAHPSDDEVMVRIEAAPINPSDLNLLLAFVDTAQLAVEGGRTLGPIPQQVQPRLASRRGTPMPVGYEGAGTVMAAGASDAAQALLGKTVSLAGGQMYAQYKRAKASDCLPLPEGVSVEEGASSFVNPMTALGMIGTMRREGFGALVHTAAASNLGQMLVKLTQAQGIGLVAIVRSSEQATLLRSIGATNIVEASSPNFLGELTAAIEQTGAYLAFDAIGGGPLASQILKAMEAAAIKGSSGFSPYGSTQKKQVYIYGGLDGGPTELARGYGMAWSVGGWLMATYLQTAGPDEVTRMQQYAVSQLKGIFASNYAARISLREMLQPEFISLYGINATGKKYLVRPAT